MRWTSILFAVFSCVVFVGCGDPDPESLSACRGVDYGDVDCDNVETRLAEATATPLRTCLESYRNACKPSPVVE